MSSTLEFRLCTISDSDAAASLLVKAHAPSDATHDVQGFYLKQLEESLALSAFSESPSKLIILGYSADGSIRAAYELPALNTFEGQLELRRGYISAEPEMRGFGSELFAGVTQILEQVAFNKGRQIIHFPQASFRHTTAFFVKRGYELIQEVDSLPLAIYHLRKPIAPKHHELSPGENDILAAIMSLPLIEQPGPAIPSYAMVLKR